MTRIRHTSPQAARAEEPTRADAGSLTQKDWEGEAKRILKAELARHGLTYKGLVLRLEAMGVTDQEKAIANRISRGKFPFTFFLQCMYAMGVSEVDLRDRTRRSGSDRRSQEE